MKSTPYKGQKAPAFGQGLSACHRSFNDFSDAVNIVCFPWSCFGSRFGSIAKDQIADAFIIALDTEFFQDRFSFFAFELFFCTMDPAAGDAQVRSSIHHVAHYEASVIYIPTACRQSSTPMQAICLERILRNHGRRHSRLKRNGRRNAMRREKIVLSRNSDSWKGGSHEFCIANAVLL